MKDWSVCKVEALMPGNVIQKGNDMFTVAVFPYLDKKSNTVYIAVREGGQIRFDENEEVEVYR